MISNTKSKMHSKFKKLMIPIFTSIFALGTLGFNPSTADAISPPSAPDGYTYNPSTSEKETTSRSPQGEEETTVATILGVTSLGGSGVALRTLSTLGFTSGIVSGERAANDTTTYTYAKYVYLDDNPTSSYGGFYIVGIQNNDTGEVQFGERQRIGTGA
ncbi:hypothetical protein SAMN05421781_0030 [Marinococcus luteus]|uniref:Uncharacterized protein n=1 Tax=Marinococcus luteus TaxID=1122204 RepID=A0A1H2YB82_9BACI|nr:hypothetical protein [Marinococcus luteus]SDX02416.1 hypothetical protein SAMN05421781_0030 [Marinococcus luteus]